VSNTLSSLQTIFREFFDDPGMVISPETSQATLADWDSVAQVHIILAIEEAFSIRFSTDEVAKVRSVADLLLVIESRR
jgi:acyl carrier protein